jgi:tetratricopeptide (TPR) repeat protein
LKIAVLEIAHFTFCFFVRTFIKNGTLIMLKNLYIFVLILFASLSVLGQSKSKIRQTNPDTTNVYSLLNYSRIVASENPSKAFDYIEKALELSIDNKNKKAEGTCYYTLANLNKDLGIYNIAVKNYTQAISIYKNINYKDGLLLCYNELGSVYDAKKDFTKSKECYNEYLKISQNIGSEDDEIKANKSIAATSANMQDYSESIQSYQEVKKQESSRKNKKGVIDANNRIGEILVKQEKPEEAKEYFQESQSIAEEINDEEDIAKSYSNLGAVHRANKEYDKELDMRQKSININQIANNNEALSFDNLEIGDMYLEQDKPEEAIPYIKKSIGYSEETNNLEANSKAQQNLSKAYAKSGNYNKALDSYQKYVELKDSILAEKEKQILARMEINALVSEKQQRIDLLEKNKAFKENEILILKQEQEIKTQSMNRQRILIYSLIVFVLLLIISAVIILRSYRQKRIANQMLALKSLRSQMNPHFIFNALNSVNSFISKSDERSANKYLSEFSRLMRSVLDNSEHNFIPLSSEINMLNLYLSLEHFRFKEKFDYEFNVSEDIDIDQFEIPPMLVQPYIENAIWHGLRYKTEKGKLHVSITEDNDILKIIIEDDGIGRMKSQEIKTENQKAKSSTGIKSIDKRLEILNSTYKLNIKAEILDINDGDISGTKVEILIPQTNNIG